MLFRSFFSNTDLNSKYSGGITVFFSVPISSYDHGYGHPRGLAGTGPTGAGAGGTVQPFAEPVPLPRVCGFWLVLSDWPKPSFSWVVAYLCCSPKPNN